MTTTTGRVLSLTIPGEPKRKQRPRFNPTTRRAVTAEETVQAESDIGWKVKAAAIEQEVELPLTGPIRVRLAFRSRYAVDSTLGVKDGDNMEKLVLDALNSIAWADDRQVVDMHWTVERGSRNPGVDIEIATITSGEIAA